MKQLYSKMKIFHYPEKVNSLPQESAEILPPLHIRIKPTNRCNHRCSYCAYRVDDLPLGGDMVIGDMIPREKMLEIIDDVQEIGVRGVTFSGGGEPFTYPHFLEVVRKLSGGPVKFASLTNGSLLKGELAEVFAHNATWIRVSIDGWDSKSYAEYRSVSEQEFGKVMSNIENFKKIGGRCYLGVVIITDHKNAEHVYELVGRVKNAGAHSCKIAPCILSGDAEVTNNYHAPIGEGVKDQIRRAVSDFGDNSFEVVDSYNTQLASFEKDYQWCPYMQVVPVIGADLNVYTCHDKAYDLKLGLLGSIKERRFKDFWFADKAKFYRINPSVHCNHHCMVNDQNKLILNYLNLDPEHLGFV